MDKKHKRTFALAICIAVFLGIVIANYAGTFVSGLIAGLVSILVPLSASLVLIFICKHVMAFLETKILNRIFKNPKGKGIRATSLIISVLFLIGIIVAVCYMFIPRTISVVGELVSNSEAYEKQLIDEVTGILASIFGSSADDMVASITDMVTQWIKDTFNSFLPQLASIGTSILGIIGNVFLGIVVGLLYLFDRENVNHYIGRMARVRMSEEKIDKTKYFLAKSDRILIDFLVAKVIECIVITVCLGIILTVIGVEASFELAFIVGVLNVIPYIGFIIALLPISLITLVYGSVTQLIQAVIWVTVVYNVITTFITPIIVGKKIKTNAIVMFISMIVGGCMFGMFGMMLGVPAGAVISEFIKEDVEHREAKMRAEAQNGGEGPGGQDKKEEVAELLVEHTQVEKKGSTSKSKKKKDLDAEKDNKEEQTEGKKEESKKGKKKNVQKEDEQDMDKENDKNIALKHENKTEDKAKSKNSGSKIKQLFSKMKYSFSNISPDEDDNTK